MFARTQKQKDRARVIVTVLLVTVVITEIVLFIAKLNSTVIFGNLDVLIMFGLFIYSFFSYITSDWRFGVWAYGQFRISAVGCLIGLFYMMYVASKGLS